MPHEILGYCRVSTIMQVRDGISLEHQEQKIRDYAKYKNMEIKNIYRDEGISGKDYHNRPGLIKLLQDLQPKQYVVVYSLSRLARNAKQATEIEEEISKKRAYLVALDFDVNTKTAVGKLLFQIMNSFNEFMASDNSEKISANMNYLSSIGKLRTKPPFGYKFVAKDKPLERDEKEQEVIEYIRFIKKEQPQLTATLICRLLQEKDFRCRKAKKWYPNVVKKIIEDNGI